LNLHVYDCFERCFDRTDAKLLRLDGIEFDKARYLGAFEPDLFGTVDGYEVGTRFTVEHGRAN
jgi:hypothetical protein